MFGKKNKNKGFNQPNNMPPQGQGRPPMGQPPRPGMPPQGPGPGPGPGMPPQGPGRPPQGYPQGQPMGPPPGQRPMGPGMPPQGPGRPPQGPGMPPMGQGRPPQGPGMPPQGQPPQQPPKKGGLFGKKPNKGPKENKGGGLFGGLFGKKDKNKPQKPDPMNQPGQFGPRPQGPGPQGPGMPPQRPQGQQKPQGPGPGMPPQDGPFGRPSQQPPQGPPYEAPTQQPGPFGANMREPEQHIQQNIPTSIPTDGMGSRPRPPQAPPQAPPINRGMQMPPNRGQRGSEYDVEREYYSKAESQEVYGKKEMSQNAFLYAPKTNFISIQKYINDTYKGIVVTGTSSLGSVIDVYKTKLNSNCILIFISTEEELEGLIQFIEYLISIKMKNPELLNVYIIVGKNVRYNILENIKNSSLCNIMQATGPIERLSTSDIDMVMSLIVQKQPTYLDSKIEKIERPRKARRRKQLDVHNLYRTHNIEELRKEINLDRDNIDPEKLYMQLSDGIVNASSTSDIDEIVSMIPELSVLQEYADDLDEYLEENDGRLSASEINKIVMSKLELTALQEEALSAIFDKVIHYAESKAEHENEDVRKSNAGMLMEMDKAAEDDLSKLLEQRAEIKERATSGFNQYKREVQFISNAIETRKYLYQNLQKQLKPVVEDDTFNAIEDDTREVTLALLKNLEDNRVALNQNKVNIQKRMVDTLNYVNSLFKEYNVLIKLDEVIIDKLIDDKNRAETMSINRVYSVDNELKARGKLIYMVEGKDFCRLSKIVYRDSQLVITNVDSMVFSDKMKLQSADQFVAADYTEKDVNVVRLKDWMDDDSIDGKMDLLINKLKFISKYYTHIIFVFDEHIDKYILNRIMAEVAEVNALTDIDKENLIKVNKFLKSSEEFENIYGRTVIFNGYDSETSPLAINEIRTLAKIEKGIREVYINTRKGLTSKPELSKLVIQLRNI